MSRLALVRRTALLSLGLIYAGCQPHGGGAKKTRDEGPPDATALGVFDPSGVGPGAPPVVPSRPLDIVGYGPIGRTEGGEIHIRFNQPVVALDLVPAEGVKGLLEFDPPLPGRAYWKTPELLVFDPDEGLRDCHGYTAKLVGAVVGLDGQKFERALQWQFETVRPTVSASHPDAGAEDHLRDAPVFVQFDRPVALAEVKAHVQASARSLATPDAAAQPVTVQVRPATKKEIEEHFYYYGNERTREIYAIKGRGPWPGDSEIVVSVTPGLRSEAGPLPLDTPWSMSFKTIRAQAIEEINCSPAMPCGLEPITIKLRNPVKEKQVKRITVSPRPKALRVTMWDDWGEGGREVTIEGVFEPGTTYTVRVPKDMRDVYGQTLGGSGELQAVIAPKATLALSTGGGILIADDKQTIGVESRHVQAVRVKVGVFDEAELRALKTNDLEAAAFPAKVVERTIALTPTGKGDWSSIALDLAELSGGSKRPMLVEVAAAELVPRAVEFGVPEPVRALVRVTDLGPLATASLPASSVQVLRLSSGQPVPGVRVLRHDERGGSVQLGVTDAGGHLGLPHGLVKMRDDKTPHAPLRLMFVDPASDDHTFLDLDDVPVLGRRMSPDDKPSPLRPGERLIAKLVSERGVYRPGEKVRVVGWSALDTPFSRSNLAHLAEGTPVMFELRDGEDRVVAVHPTKTTAEGKYWAELPVPAEARLGRYTVKAALAGGEVKLGVKVEDYRVPEFAVEARAQRTDVLAGETTAIDVDASYYFGGPVPITRVATRTDCVERRFRPPGLEDIWTVGEPMQWHRIRAVSPRVIEALPSPPPAGRVTLTSRGTTERVQHPHRCDIAVEVQDASLQAIGAEAQYLIHPASFYLAVALPRGYREAGERGVTLPVRAVDFAGTRVAAEDVTVEVIRHWREESYRTGARGEQIYTGMVDKSATMKTCELDLAASGDDAACELPALIDGRFEVKVSGEERGADPREARTAGMFHVWKKSRYDWRGAPADRLEIKTSSGEVKPGDTLEVAVQGPWPGASGNLVVARGGVRESRPFVLTDGAAEFSFVVDDNWTSEVALQASIVTPKVEGVRRLPQVMHADARVTMGHDHRRLAVQVDAPAKAGPGDSIDVGVRVRDDQGRPTAARVALWAVDEAVLALTDWTAPDMLPEFVPRRGPEVVQRDDYRALLWPFTPTPDDPWFAVEGGLGLSGHGYGAGGGSGSGFGSGAGRGGAAGPPPARSRFETTPVFLADLAVDASGDARVTAAMPENLTTFRITAIASANLVDGASPGRFGANDARTMLTAPLVLRSALPRQLRPGDEAEFAAIVQNYTGAAGRVEVAAKIVDETGAEGHDLEFMSEKTASAELEVGGQVRLPFKVVARGPGAPEVELQATFTPEGGGAPVYDGMRVPVPVEPERTLTERVATYGDLADDTPVAIPIKIPAAVLPGHGGITVAATSSLMGGLEDAVKELVTYPYGCVEQTSSKLLPMIALAPLRETYPLGVADPALHVREGIERLLSMQTTGGGFGYWPGAADVHVYASAYATWVLYLAKQAGYAVPEDALKKALDDLEARFAKLSIAGIPVDWNHLSGARAAIGLHVLADAGRDVAAAARELFAVRQSLPLFGRAFLLMALHRQDPQGPEVATLATELRGSLRELQATAHAVEQEVYGLDELFSSDGRSDAIILMALLRVEPQHPVVVKLARGLLERRVGGAWRNTQENAYALVALADYARVYEAEVPDFTASAWVGGQERLSARFKGRGFASEADTVGMGAVLDLAQRTGSDTVPVILRREGQGRMYYRLGAEWAPATTELPARTQGLALTRALRTAEGAAGAAIDAGTSVAIDITVRNDTRVRYVVVDVPLPAGLEAVSRTLGRGRKAATLGHGYRGWWVTHEEQRRDRVVLFADDLPPGTHTHTIDVRATGRGRFSFPPAQAEAMYMPEVYGRTTGATLEIR